MTRAPLVSHEVAAGFKCSNVTSISAKFRHRKLAPSLVTFFVRENFAPNGYLCLSG